MYEEDLYCPLCGNIYKDPVVLCCGQSVCKVCLEHFWRVKGSRVNPFCKGICSKQWNPPNYALRNLGERLIQEGKEHFNPKAVTHQMDVSMRRQLQEDTRKYIAETLSFIQILNSFPVHEWTVKRAEELQSLREIEQNKKKSMSNRKQEKLETELGEVLEDTLKGLEKLSPFLEAVEQLAVTSLYVFDVDQCFSQELTRANICSVISSAKMVAPLLVLLKRDNAAIFLPHLINLEEMMYYLQMNINITNKLCEELQKGQLVIFNDPSQIHIIESLSMESIQTMHGCLKQLNDIRMDQDLRLALLFQEHAGYFIRLYDECQSRMLTFLSDIENKAVQLDKMKFRTDVSGVTSATVALVGGVINIFALSFIPFFFDVFFFLSVICAFMSVLSNGANLANIFAEVCVNRRKGEAAHNTFKSFMEEVRKIINCLRSVASRNMREKQTCTEGIRDIEGTRALPNRLSTSESVCMILRLYLPYLDMFFIYEEVTSLKKGSKSDLAEKLRSRSSLWRSELDTWKEIRDSLSRGITKLKESLRILEKPFYPQQVYKNPYFYTYDYKNNW